MSDPFPEPTEMVQNTSKIDEKTYRQTDRQTDRQTEKANSFNKIAILCFSPCFFHLFGLKIEFYMKPSVYSRLEMTGDVTCDLKNG